MIKITPLQKDQLDIFITLIKELADYERMLDDIKFDKAKLEKSIFKDQFANACLIYYDNQPVGYIIYYFTFSSFLGAGGMHLEDLYVRESYRKKGCAKAAFAYLKSICKAKNLERIEWVCLRDNYPAIEFYESKLGASNMSKIWLMYRLDDKGINKL